MNEHIMDIFTQASLFIHVFPCSNLTLMLHNIYFLLAGLGYENVVYTLYEQDEDI
jgi:hypothetical protein